MMLVEGVEYYRVWWANSDHPDYRDHVKDAPTTGWSGALLLETAPDAPVYLLCPSTLSAFEVARDCPEIRTAKEPGPINKTRLMARMITNYRERDRLGLSASWDIAARAIEALGGKVPVRTREEVAPTVQREPKAPKQPSAKKIAREGLTGISEIAGSIDMTAKEARGILRAQKVEKPEAGWVWDVKKAETIKKLLLKNRK